MSESKKTYLERLALAVQHLHHCGATHASTVKVTETFRGQVLWDGEVEVFQLTGHPKARQCYAWSHRQDDTRNSERFVAVLEIDPVDSPQAAVKVAVSAEIRATRSKSKKP